MDTVKKICIVGSGVVGQATGRGFLSHGFDVVFVDVRPEIIEQLRSEGLTAYTPSELEKLPVDYQVTIFTVSTPTRDGVIQLQYLKQAAEDCGRRLQKATDYHVIVVRSTVIPGTTEQMVVPAIEKFSGKKAGVDFGVCMNPEYLREKTAVEDFKNPWIIVIGQQDNRAGDVVHHIYSQYSCPIHRLSVQEAEIQKYTHNLFNAVKIGFFNEMRSICQKVGADADTIFARVAESSEGMWNPQYGIRDFGPFDGMCLPKDTQAFWAWAQTKGWEMPQLKAAIDFNNDLLAARQTESVMTEAPASARQPAVATA